MYTSLQSRLELDASVLRSRTRLGLLAIQLAFVLILATLILRSPLRLIYDEPDYLNYVALLHKFGFSGEFLTALNGAAGPLFGGIHLLLEPFTGLQPVPVRFVSFGFFLAAMSLVWATLRNLRFPHAWTLASAAIVIPMTWVIGGLSLTEGPAIFLATASFFLLTISVRREWGLPGYLAAGALLGLAATGRQPLVLLGFVPLAAAMLRRLSIVPALGYLALSLAPLSVCVSVWHALTPPVNYADGLSRAPSFSLQFAVFSFGYAAIAIVLVAPRFFAFRLRTVIITVSACLLVNGSIGVVVLRPFRATAESLLSPRSIYLYERLAGGILLAAGVGCAFALLKRAWEERDNFVSFCSLLSCWLTCLSAGFIPWQYSSRYTVLCWPFLLISVRYHRPDTPLARVLAVVGGLIGVVSLTAYFRFNS